MATTSKQQKLDKFFTNQNNANNLLECETEDSLLNEETMNNESSNNESNNYTEIEGPPNDIKNFINSNEFAYKRPIGSI